MRFLFFIASLFVLCNSVIASSNQHHAHDTQIQDTVYKDYKQFFQVSFFNEWRSLARQNVLEAITLRFSIGDDGFVKILGFSANTKTVYIDFMKQVVDRLNRLETKRKPFVYQLYHADSCKRHVFLVTFMLDLFDGRIQNRRNDLQEGLLALVTSKDVNYNRSLSGNYDAEPIQAIILDPVVIKSPFTYR